MAEQTPSEPVELGAPMDYAEHNRTYDGFIILTKIGTLATIAILQALTLYGLAANGFWAGTLLLVLMLIGTVIGMLTKGSVKALVGVIIIGFILMALLLG